MQETPSLTIEEEQAISDQLHELLARFGAAIEFWSVACVSQDSLGNPTAFVNDQWEQFRDRVHTLRTTLHSHPHINSISSEQVAKLMKVCADLREIFDALIDYRSLHPKDLELTVLRLSLLWRELRLRVILLSVVIPLPPPLPSLTSEQEAYYQSILDSLFDRFSVNRPSIHQPISVG